MRLDLKSTRVYVISPGTGVYRDRLLTIMGRLADQGYEHVTFVKSRPAATGTASLTATLMDIFRAELRNDDPFIVLEDDCAIWNICDSVDVPESMDALYLGVALWSYPHSVETLSWATRPHIIKNHAGTVSEYDANLTRLRGMTGGHAILFQSREFLRRFLQVMETVNRSAESVPHDLVLSALHASFEIYALKEPLFYQDAALGGQESVTRLRFQDGCYS